MNLTESIPTIALRNGRIHKAIIIDITKTNIVGRREVARFVVAVCRSQLSVALRLFKQFAAQRRVYAVACWASGKTCNIAARTG